MKRWCMAALVLGLGATPAAAQKVWRHAIIEAKSDAGFAMMVTRGFAEKQGLKLEILRMLQVNELRHVEGGIDDSVLTHCQNQRTAASSGPVCCA